MTEILTESFCERCGTRYTFESARPKARLRGVKVLSRGLKNFVLSDDTSMNEAMAAARSESEREATAHQLDAFHKTFSFCMSCRQYSCPNCWNGAEARCLSCAPLAVQEAPAALDELTSLRAAVLIGEPTAGNGTSEHEHEAWPAAVAAEAEELGALEADEPVAAQAVAPEVTSAEAASDAAAADPADRAAKAANQTASLLRRFRPGENLDAELDAYERDRADAGGPESVAAAGEPAVVEGPPPTAEPEAAPQLAAAAADVVEQPTWRITAPDVPAAPRDVAVPLQASPSATGTRPAEPQWPARPEWPSSTPTAGLPFLGRPAAPQGGIDALWAASNQELVAAPAAPGRPAASGIRPCVSCGLSLSASARFCRRCGTVQER